MIRDAGFTLLELMVALVVLGLLLAGLAQGVGFGLRTYSRQTGILAQAGRQNAVDRALRRLITEARPGQAGGTAHELRLITTLPAAASVADRRIDAAIYVDSRHDLVMAWSPHRPGHALIPPSAPRIEVLAHGILQLDVRYWWPRSVFGAPTWQTRGPAGGLPRLIRLRIIGSDHRPRPDLIAAPALAAAH
jgi:general secretion pathway protein J